MPLIRGKVLLILGFVFLTTLLAAVRGLPVRKQRSHSPKERSSKLAEVRQPLGKDGEPPGCWGEPSSASAPVPGKAEEGRRPPGRSLGSLGVLPCISEGSSIRHVSPRPGCPQPRLEKQQRGEGRVSCLSSSALFLHSLRGRALSQPPGFSGSLGSLHCPEAAGKGLV